MFKCMKKDVVMCKVYCGFIGKEAVMCIGGVFVGLFVYLLVTENVCR